VLTSKITKTLTVPDETGSITIRKLSHHQLMQAIDAKRDAALAMMRKLEGVTLPQTDGTVDADAPENKYDRMTVLRHGVTAWSYDIPPEQGVEDLDEESAIWLFSEIIAFSVRSAADVKASANGSQPTSDRAEAVGLSN
jgi:hypothetical protein